MFVVRSTSVGPKKYKHNVVLLTLLYTIQTEYIFKSRWTNNFTGLCVYPIFKFYHKKDALLTCRWNKYVNGKVHRKSNTCACQKKTVPNLKLWNTRKKRHGVVLLYTNNISQSSCSSALGYIFSRLHNLFSLWTLDVYIYWVLK